MKDVYIYENFKNYKNVFNQANDSINKWCEDSLSITKFIRFGNWEIDSVFIFNNDSTLFFGVVCKSSKFKNAVMDELSDFAGRKINGKWHFFFMGVYHPVRRSYWQYDAYAPLSFEELSYVAYERRFKGMIENIMLNDGDKIDMYFRRIFDTHKSKDLEGEELERYLDENVLKVVSGKYKYKLTQKEIEYIQKEIEESVRPEEPPRETKAWWQFWKKEPRIPIFETEEWKQYLQQKYGEDCEKHL